MGSAFVKKIVNICYSTKQGKQQTITAIAL